MSKINWAYMTVFGMVALLVVLIGVSLLGRAYGGWSYGMMGSGMMNWGFAPFGWLGMIFMWLIPLAFLASARGRGRLARAGHWRSGRCLSPIVSYRNLPGLRAAHPEQVAQLSLLRRNVDLAWSAYGQEDPRR